MYHANTNQKKAGEALLISDKRDFREEKITKDQEGHYITIKGSIHQGDRTVLNVHAPNKRVSATWSKNWQNRKEKQTNAQL